MNFFVVYPCPVGACVCIHLTDETGGAALTHPQAELPLLPLAQLSLCTCSNEHRILINQRLMEDLGKNGMSELKIPLITQVKLAFLH